ncbi:MAG: NUDIX hydrolase N-terminal domain-containing protein [Chloroflexota bacterium]
MDIFPLLNEIQAIARNGLHYTTNPYDQERYNRLLTLAIQSYSDLLEISGNEIAARFLAELGQITPKVGSDAAIFNEADEILLMERADGTGWCLPCGWVEPNEKPIEAAIREVKEETGLEIAVKQLVGVFTRMPSATNGPHTMIAIVHLCEILGGELTLSHEGLNLQYWAIDDMENWHATHEQYARAAYRMWKSDQLMPSISD